MYIPPGFTLITCEPMDEAALQSWAIANGGIWHPARSIHHVYQYAYAEWDFGSYHNIIVQLSALSDKDIAKWTPLMRQPPQSVIDVELLDEPDDGDDSYASVIRTLFKHWDGYASDIGAHEWVSVLLRDLLPAERIICCEPPPLSAGPAWIWINGKYTKNEFYEKNEDTQ